MLPKHTENTENTKSKNMHSGDHFGIAAVSTTDVLLLSETVLCNASLATAETGNAGTHNDKSRDSLASTYKVLTAQSVSENDRWQ